MHDATGNYHGTFVTGASAGDVYKAITENIRMWWSADFMGTGRLAGHSFTVRFGNTFKVMRVLHLFPPQHIKWECIDQHIEMPGTMEPLQNPREWVGNIITWTISNEGLNTRVTLCHVGLTPASECWAVCEPGWTQTLASLQRLLSTGAGNPFVHLDEEHMKKAREWNRSR